MMNVVSGKVVLKDSGVGIPDVLVEVYDVDPEGRADEVFTGVSDDGRERPVLPTTAGVVPHRIAADRIGAVATAGDGTFRLEYDDAEFRVRNSKEARPDLLIVVVAPDGGPETRGMELYRSSLVRENAGRREEFLIRIGKDLLEKAEIAVPTTQRRQDSAENVRDRLLASEARYQQVIDEGVRVIQKGRVDRVRRTADTFQAQVLPALRRNLSRVSDGLARSQAFVQPHESVAQASIACIRRGITDVINDRARQERVKTRRYVSLTSDQREALRQEELPNGAVPAAAVARVLRAASRDVRGVRELIRTDPTLPMRREPSAAELAAARLLGLEPPASTPPAGGASTGGASGTSTSSSTESELSEAEVKALAGRVVTTLTSPEEDVLVRLEPRATRSEVATSLGTLALPPSPADTVAFHDFNTLQIAFDHVWQEVIDDGIINLAEHVFYEIVERGGDPGKDAEALAADPLGVLTEEGRRVLLATRAQTFDEEVLSFASGGADPSLIPPQTMSRVSSRPRSGPPIRDHRTNPKPWRPSGSAAPPRADSVDPRDHGTATEDPLPDLLRQLRKRLRSSYPFTVYAANAKERSINFGIVTTYRQTWEPQAYQAGKLAKTATLAPRESRKYSKKTVTKVKRSEKEVETHLRVRRDEMSSTTRAEQQIVRKAHVKTNFELTSQDSVKVPLSEAVTLDHTQQTSFKREAGRESEDVKRAFHEAVFKAAQEYKDETTTEVTVESSEEVEVTESGEITNPNDEIAVTFLFYELQRRYKISERLHRLTPVVLVAQEVPNPSDIDGDWVLAHDWILRRILLDDSFLPAITYLTQTVMGDEVALGQLRENVEQQRAVVEELKRELALVREKLAAFRGLGDRSMTSRWSSGGGGGGDSWLSDVPVVGHVAEAVVNAVTGAASEVGEWLFGGGGGDGSARKDALNEAMQRAADQERDLLFRLEREVTALNSTTEAYTKTLTQHFNQQGEIARLFVHIKDNILHYMQGIWTHEPPDQRFFRLHKVRVPVFAVKSETYDFTDNQAVPLGEVAHRRVEWIEGVVSESIFEAEVAIELEPEVEVTTLAEVADLDNLLGFKGNYMIFPLKESNAVTDYMMAPYVVEGLNELIDPDGPGNWTLDDFAAYVQSLKDNLTADQFAELKEQLQAQYKELVSKRLRDGEILTVATGALFIEALPAGHSLIEHFKAMHRALDVKRAQADVRRLELENLRYAARIVGHAYEDPEIERKIVIEGGSSVVVPPEA